MWGKENFNLEIKFNFDLILCTEVIYNEINIFPLLETIKILLNQDNYCLLTNHYVRFDNHE